MREEILISKHTKNTKVGWAEYAPRQESALTVLGPLSCPIFLPEARDREPRPLARARIFFGTVALTSAAGCLISWMLKAILIR